MMLTVRQHRFLLVFSVAILILGLTPAAGAAPDPTLAQVGIPSAAGTFVPLPPTRILDTAFGNGAVANIPARSSIIVQIGGRGGVPNTDVASVMLNLQAVTAAAAGYLTLYAGGGARPTASNLNFTVGTTISTLAIAPLSAMGGMSVYNGSNAPIRVIADLAGYYIAGTASQQGTFTSLAPQRILDTFTGNGASANIPAKGSIKVQIGGRAGVPASGASSAVLNLQAVTPGSTGYLTLYADGASRPAASQLNFTPEITISTLAVTPLSAGGAITVYNGSTTPVRVIADLAGYHLGNMPTAEGAFFGIAPQRILDTGTGNGAATNIPARGSITVQVTGRGGIPSSGVADAVLTLQAVTPVSPGYLTLHAAGTTRPTASNLNFTTGKTIATLAVAPLSASGAFIVYNGSNSPIRVIGDIAGYHLSTVSSGMLTWGPSANIMTGIVFDISCVTTSFCAAVSRLGESSFFNGTSWSAPSQPDAGHLLRTVSCSSKVFCIAADDDGRWLKFDGANWGTPQSLGTGPINSVSCPTSTFCLAVLNSGDPNYTAQTAIFNGTTWTTPVTAAVPDASRASCTSPIFCHLVGGSVSKIYNGASWSAPLTPPFNLNQISCATPNYCVATKSPSYHSTNVSTFDGTSWSAPVDIDGGAPSIGDIACPTANFCVTTATLQFINGSDGVVAYQLDGSTWSSAVTLTADDVSSGPVSCPTDKFCVTGIGDGNVVVGIRS